MGDTSLSALLLLAESATGASPEEGLSISLALVIVGVLLFINGYFVALEFALVAVRKTRVDELVRQKKRGALSVQRGKNNVDDFVATAQLGITIASLALGMVAEDTVLKILDEWFHWKLSHESGLGFFISITLVTIFHVVVGEQVPKMLAIEKPAKVAMLAAPPAEFVLKLCKPAIWLLSWMTSLVLKMFGIKKSAGGHGGEIYSEEEIQDLLASREQAGLAEAAEGEMIAKVFNLFDMVATQIMIPRTEMVCIPATASVRDVVQKASSEGHDRYPIYGQNTDEIVGILLMKDLVAFLGENPDGLDSGITELWREPMFVPGSLPCAELMTRMREKRTRLVIVLDEYGGTAGMLTLGDVLNRLVGEVDEESEDEEPESIVAVGENRYSVSGLVLTEDVEKFFGITIEDDLNDTIGGVIFSKLGRAPEVGDDIELEELIFRVDALDGMRIDRLLVNTQPGSAAS